MELKQVIFSTKFVDDINKKLDEGYILSRSENPYLDNIRGVRKSGLTFKMTNDEYEEYLKCAVDIFHFAKYCKIKNEEGKYDYVTLRDYQNDILNLYNNNPRCLLNCSRQSGKTISTSLFILHYITFKAEKTLLIGAHVGKTATEILDKIKEIYSSLPFFLKQGITKWNEGTIICENKCKIRTFNMTKNSGIGNAADLVFLDEFAHIPANIIEKFYKSIIPTLSSIKNSKLIVTSTPEGLNLFSKLYFGSLQQEGHPEKNPFKSMTIKWDRVPGRMMIYIKPNIQKLEQHNIKIEDLYNHYRELYNPLDEYDINKIPYTKLRKDMTTGATVIDILIRENIVDVNDIRASLYNDLSVLELAIVSTWKENAIREIGSESAFNQEYDLRFINTAKSVLPEKVMERINNSKLPFTHKPHDIFDKLTWDYSKLLFIDDESIFNPENRKKIKGFITVDVSEGLGLDYSVINIFKIKEKPADLIMKQYKKYTAHTDFFQLEQIGMFRSNTISVAHLAEMVYLLAFDYFDEDNFKVVLELNNHGHAVVEAIKNVFNQDNYYSSVIFMKYKHRLDATDKRIGLKVGKNKNLFVKEYSDKMCNQEIILHEEQTIFEVNTFIQHDTAGGGITYKADGGSTDDSIMSVVNMATVFSELPYKEMCDALLPELLERNFEFKKIYEEIMGSENKTGTDYTAFNNVYNNMYNTYRRI